MLHCITCMGCFEDQHAFELHWDLCRDLVLTTPSQPIAEAAPGMVAVPVGPIGAQGVVSQFFRCPNCVTVLQNQHALDLHRALCFDVSHWGSQPSIDESVPEMVAVPVGPIAGMPAVGEGMRGVSPVSGGELDRGLRETELPPSTKKPALQPPGPYKRPTSSAPMPLVPLSVCMLVTKWLK